MFEIFRGILEGSEPVSTCFFVIIEKPSVVFIVVMQFPVSWCLFCSLDLECEVLAGLVLRVDLAAGVISSPSVS